MTDFLLLGGGAGERRVQTKVVDSVEALRPLLNPTAWEIVKLLRRKESYPAEIAKKLNLNEQTVYYYIKQLKASGLIEVARTEEKQGATAKFFRCNFDSFSLVASAENAHKAEFTVAAQGGKAMNENLRQFLEPFIVNGRLDAKIVVGSPDPHGEMKARARDGHLAVELAAFLGSLSTEINYPLIYLDTQIPSLEQENSNLILLGGPITNKLAEEVNEKMSLRFVSSGGQWLIKSKASDKEYAEDSVGFIEKIPHPHFPNRAVLVIAGKRNAGTRAAIIGLIKHTDELVKPNKFDERLHARVVEGLDLDGDGIIDNVEVKE